MKSKEYKMTNEMHVTNLINWHRFLTDMVAQNNDNMNYFLSEAGSLDTYGKMRKFSMMSDKNIFLTQELYKAEHDLIDAAIVYNVPHTKMLKDGHAEDFYTLLTTKARDIDKKGVTLIRKC